MTSFAQPPAKLGLLMLATALALFGAASVADASATQRYFVDTTYYALLAAVLCWTGTYLYAARDVRRADVVAWLKENWPGILLALTVTTAVAIAVTPALRMLSDEANLIGTSKNLFASKTATFTVSGKNYYDSYWDVDVSIDRRPTLFPFLVSLIHALVGYSYRNAFALNLLVLPAFLLIGYRLAKSLGGETFGIVAALFAVAHPITMLTVRSAGFDLLAAFFGLLVIKNLNDFTRQQSPANLAILWLNLCLFAEVRYESALFIAPVVGLLLLFRMVSWELVRPYGFVYAVSPAFLLPRVWQSILLGNVPEQDPGTVTFSLGNFLHNSAQYFRPVWSPRDSYPAHTTVLITAGVLGCVLWLRWLVQRVRARAWTLPQLRFGVFLLAFVAVQGIISFGYFWGQAQYPSAARLLIALDTFFSFAAAWLVTVSLQRWQRFVPVLLAAAVLLTQLPVAAQHRFLNRLTQTRESATTWRFFERLGEKRILIVTDRPNHFTIMEYGAMSFDAARRDPHIFTAFARHLFYDIYVIQQVELSTGVPLPGYELWPNRNLVPVLEFQNDANVLIRISRLAH